MYHLSGGLDARFDTIISGNYGSVTTRCRIYSVDPSLSIDYANEAEVINYGTLLKYYQTDTDSNGRIAQSGLKFHDYYCKEDQINIGQTVSNRIDVELINDDGAMSSFNWDYHAVFYLDLYDSANNSWLSVPLGVYLWERPKSTMGKTVSVSALDLISTLETAEDFSIDGLDYSGGIILYDLYKDLFDGYQNIRIDPNLTSSNMTNGSHAYYKTPCDCEGMSRRDLLAWIAQAAGSNARIDRRNYLTLRYFITATNSFGTYTFSADTTPSHIGNLQIADYDVPAITSVSAKIGQIGSNYTYGSGENVIDIIDNGLFAPKASVQGMTNAVYARINTQFRSAYRPITAVILDGDWRLEAGDIIDIVYNGQTYTMPIFEQTLEWRGGSVRQTIVSSGYAERKGQQKQVRSAHNVSSRIYNASSQSGIITASSVASGSTSDISVTFDVPFNKNPIVVASIFSSQTTGMGQCSVSVYNITTTGCSIRLTNGYSSARSLGATWIAVSQ